MSHKRPFNKFAFTILLSLFSLTMLSSIPSLVKNENSYDTLKNLNLIQKNSPIRLHLGCGQTHLNGYINIDFPPTEHTTQTKQGADVFGDITQMNFPLATVDEIRLHHVFEHFDRQTTLALLCGWQQWLKVDGILHIETPDFEASIKQLLQTDLTYTQKQLIIRHIFGSHEASWALHYDGWYKEKYEHILNLLGFKILKIQQSNYRILHNITVIAQKISNIEQDVLTNTAKKILRESMNGNDENLMWSIWCNAFDKQMDLLNI